MADEKTGYPPAQPGYPTQQPGYPPQQPGYPPQQAPPGGQPYPPAGQAPPPAYNAAYPPPQGQAPPAQSVIVTTVVTGSQFREQPVALQCPNCHNNVTSNIVLVNGALMWVVILVVAIVFELWCGCCLIPLLIDGLKDVEHICPVCSYKLGVYKRL